MRELPPWSLLQVSQVNGTVKHCWHLMLHAQAQLVWVALVVSSPSVRHAKCWSAGPKQLLNSLMLQAKPNLLVHGHLVYMHAKSWLCAVRPAFG